MSIFDRGLRGNVQSPFQSANDAAGTAYTNPRLPSAFGGNVQLALDYLLAAVYPNYKGTVNTPADLPTTGMLANDYYIVLDDGDGKSAGYIYSVLEGASQWIKRYDVDWSYEGLLADTATRISYMYAAKYGTTDKDATGAPITGVYAGQRIFGGDQTLQNLTLTANSFDLTGFVQTDNSIVPTVDDAVDLGAFGAAFRGLFLAQGLRVGTTELTPGLLSDTGGAFSFGNNDLDTTGKFTAASAVFGTLELGPGSIVDTSGEIDFDATNIKTAGTIAAASGSSLADITFSNGTFDTLSAVFSFSSKDISGVGTLTSSKVVTDEAEIQSLVLSGQTLKTNADLTALILQAGNGGNATTVEVNSAAKFNYDVEVLGGFSAAQVAFGQLDIGTTLRLSSDSANGRIEALTGDLQLLAQGNVSVYGALLPDVDGTRDLGANALRFRDLKLSGAITNGTDATSIATITSLRDINTGVAPGNSIFWDGTKWVPSSPDLEIDHRTINHLTDGDSGHTQFAMLAGRAGGQTISGGTAAAENLTLDSTANATKGLVLVSSVFAPSSDGLLDLGSASRNFKDIYSSGIHKGLRLDQYAGPANYPANSGTRIGRVIFDTVKNTLVVDNGTTWSSVGGSQKFVSDLTWDGVQTTQTVTVSSAIEDARTAVWQLADNTNGFERIYAKMTFTQTQVTITVSPALPAGTYRLIGIN